MDYQGIYKITNKISNKSYIGQSIHIFQRWREHSTGRGNEELYEDLQKYGIQNFTFEILDICENQEQINEKESYWIEFYKSNLNGYNKSAGGNAWPDKITESNKKEIFCYDLDGNFIKKYNSLSDAERELNINNSNISRAAKNQGRTLNYQWSYEYIEKMPKYKRKCFTGNINKGNTIKKVNQYDKNFNYIQTFNSITIAAKETGANATCIGEICKTEGKGQRKTSGGYIWRYADDEVNIL